jgi:hypothetical protein
LGGKSSSQGLILGDTCSIELRSNVGIKSVWLQALIFFAIFVAVWLLFDLIAGDAISSRSVVSAVIAGAIAALIFVPLTNYYKKRKNRA